MLEFTYYNTEKFDNLKDFFTVSFVLINHVYNEIIHNSIKSRRNISDSEKAWFYFVKKDFSDLFPNICDRTRFNKTKRTLYKEILLLSLKRKITKIH